MNGEFKEHDPIEKCGWCHRLTEMKCDDCGSPCCSSCYEEDDEGCYLCPDCGSDQ